MNFKNSTYDILAKSLNNAINDNKFPSDAKFPAIKIEYPKDVKFGDTSTSFAMESAKILRKSPMEIGAILTEYIEKFNEIEKVNVVKPGFINFMFSFEFIYKHMGQILKEKDNYGKSKKEKPGKINIEFVSANPTGPLNIVSARAAANGDALANLLEANGDIVNREFYINDYGNQVGLLGESVYARMKEIEGEDVIFPEEGYQGDYIKNIAQNVIDNDKSEIDDIKSKNELIEFLSLKAVEYNLNGQKNVLGKFNVNFDTWFSERELHVNNDVNDAYKLLESEDVIYTEENKKIFKSTDYNDDKDRVVVRDDGRPTYLLADIAYHRDKIKRGYDLIIDIWGPDHHGYIARLAGAMEVMGYDNTKFKVLIAQQVNLVVKGETVKMSKRLGQFSTMTDLIDEIGVDVARYFFIMRSLESHLDFDLTLAKKESSENPVFYLQYAHARICSIFREAEKRGINFDPEKSKMESLNNQESIILIKMMLKFPEEINSAAESLEPHRIPTYLLRLAQAFHKFYTEHKVLTDNIEKTNSFLKLSDSVRIVLKNGLKLLGVAAPKKM